MEPEIRFRIAHISDTHISDFGQFVESAFREGTRLLRNLSPKPNVIIHSGDLTDNGVLSEYKMALDKLAEFDQRVIITSGNHDQKNLGYMLFDEFIGKLDYEVVMDNIQFLIINSAQPDRDEGRIGRRRAEWVAKTLLDDKIKILVFHHHLVPVPFAGREVNLLDDAGEILDLAIRKKVNIVLMGHRHVRSALKVEDLLLVNAGTFSCRRTRGKFGYSFNIIDITEQNEVLVKEVSIGSGKITLLKKIGLFFSKEKL